MALTWKCSTTRQLFVFKLEAGLEVRLVGRIVTVWGEIRGPLNPHRESVWENG